MAIAADTRAASLSLLGDLEARVDGDVGVSPRQLGYRSEVGVSLTEQDYRRNADPGQEATGKVHDAYASF